jgi:hypothetical protein
MASRSRKSVSVAKPKGQGGRKIGPATSIPLAEVLSFLKEVRATASWTAKDVARSLKISAAEAERVIPLLQAQGYVEPAGDRGWLTTAAGDDVAGSKPARFTPEAVAGALDALAGRIEAANKNPKAHFRVTKALAFGDFLSGRARVQAPDVGIQLVARDGAPASAGSAINQAAEREFLRQLKGKGALLNVRPYEEWMSSRTHRNLP